MDKKHVIINLFIVGCLVGVSAVYSLGGGLKAVNVFLNTQREIPIYCVETNENKIAMSFDIAWGEENVDEILDILDRNNVKVTFFLVGDWANKYPQKVKKIYEKGHELGNHSMTHPHFTQLSIKQMKEEIYETDEKIKSITGNGTILFRPPYGDYNSEVVRVSMETGHYCIQWDVEKLDIKVKLYIMELV